MAESVKVEGGARLRRTLKQAGADLSALTDAHAAAAKLVADRARTAAPRRSGKLAQTIRPSGTKTRAVVRAGYKSVPYAGPIHWGWPRRNITAQPFLAETAARTEPTWLGIYMQAVNKTIDQVDGA